MSVLARRCRAWALVGVASWLLAGCADDGFVENPEDPLVRVAAFAHPSGEGLMLAEGESIIAMRYGAALDAASLRVWLNGAEVTDAFAPRPRAIERVNLAGRLNEGSNEFVFEFAPVLDDGRSGRTRTYSVRMARAPADVQPQMTPLFGAVTEPPPRR